MKNNFYIFIFLFVFVGSSNAQWQPDVRLTNDPGVSYISDDNRDCIAANGVFVHVVWYDNRDGNNEIYYKRSPDGGISWGTDIRLTNNLSNSYNPTISVSSSDVHVVWVDLRDGNPEIYYKRSTNGGINWEADIRLTNNPAASYTPSISVLSSVVHVIWRDDRDGNPEMYYKRSPDGGLSWGVDVRLTNHTAISQSPTISVSGLFLHTVWVDQRDGNWEIYYKRSTDGGINWETETRLSNNPAASLIPSISVSSSFVHVVWVDDRDGNPEIYYKRSPDAGISWGVDTRLTYDSSTSDYSSIMVSGSNLHVVWHDFRNGNLEIYYKRSTEGGLSWETDSRLTNNSSDSKYPTVAISGQIVHVLWCDNRDGNYEIYYKRNPTGNPIGINVISTETPKVFSLFQNYPNPFNPSTKIKFALPKKSFVKLGIYDITGKEIAALVNEELNVGMFEVDWDAGNFSSGVYFYRLEAGEFVETKRMGLIK